MTSLGVRMLGAVAVTGIAVAAGASPATASVDSDFALESARVTAYGSYEMMMSIPERPVPPVAVNGTLAVNAPGRCGVVQIATNGPADELVWRTFAALCTPGKTTVQTRSELLWGGFKPRLRLCVGTTVARAERGRVCDTYTPPVD
ncbi:hypothetical protein [Micromonospora sp. IBSANI012]|uniref:hypothetical protein n=1 Tax=Micromonospora sp. IBSANI012 TaxID=3457761 RepID=UPI004059ACC0